MSFRTLVEEDIPLNEGCMKPLDVIVPPGLMLRPNYPAAVVAGNVETCQAITDALYGALGVLAGAQGTMNNLTFGKRSLAVLRDGMRRVGGGTRLRRHRRGAYPHDQFPPHRPGDPRMAPSRCCSRASPFAAARAAAAAPAAATATVRRIRFLEPMTAAILSSHRKVPPPGAGRRLDRRRSGATMWSAPTARSPSSPAPARRK